MKIIFKTHSKFINAFKSNRKRLLIRTCSFHACILYVSELHAWKNPAHIDKCLRLKFKTVSQAASLII